MKAAAVALFCLLAGCVQAQWEGDPLTNEGQLKAPNPVTCLCSDASPRATIYYNVSYTCLDQLRFGSCDQDFIVDSQIKEIPEGWCQITCGRCSCCKTVADVATEQGLTTLVAAAKAAGLDAQLAAPASMFTLLAPTDEAFAAYLDTLGVDSLEALPVDALKTVLLYHIIPPHVGIDAVWTSPFFEASDGADIDTAIPNAPLSFTAANGDITITGDSNSASIVEADIEACKSYINTIDAVLVPPESAQPADLPANAGNIALVVSGPAPSASEQANALSASATDSGPGDPPTVAVSAAGK